MKRFIGLLAVVSLLLVPVLVSAALYRYQDETGKAYVTGDYMNIPEQYHSSVTVVTTQGTDTRAPSYGGQRKGKQTKSIPADSSPRSLSAEQPPGHGETTAPPEGGGSWLELHREQLKIAGAVVLAIAGFILVGKLVTFMPRQVALIIKFALVAALGTYLFKANAERFTAVIEQVKAASHLSQKMIDNRSDMIKKQAE